jgi:cephalosporin hydroxylase
MHLTIDMEAALVVVSDGGQKRELPLSSPEAFEIISEAWLRAGWDVKYVYSFNWLGRPIIQLPEDMFRLQELIYQLRPALIIETGVAHGGSLVFYAGLCRIMGHGRVIGVDIELRPQNRAALEAHELSDLITLVEGDSAAEDTLARVKNMIRSIDSVMVLLDANHTKSHVLAELNAYAPLITPGSYIIVMDGIMEKLAGAPRSRPDWGTNNPQAALRQWLDRNPDYVLEEPAFGFNEGQVKTRVTYWPNAFVRRLR